MNDIRETSKVLKTLEVFVVLSFRWLNLEGFYAYTIPQKSPHTPARAL